MKGQFTYFGSVRSGATGFVLQSVAHKRGGKVFLSAATCGQPGKKKRLSPISKRLLVLEFLKACILTLNLISHNLQYLLSAMNLN